MSVSFDPKFIKFSKSGTAGSSLLTDLVSYWKLDETGAGANATDEEGVTTLTNHSATTNQSGILGTSFQLSGSSASYIGGESGSSYSFASNISVQAWINSSTTAAYQCVFANRNTTAAGWELVLTSPSGYAAWTVRNTGAVPTSASVTGSTNICDGAWHHVVATFDGTSAKLYVDGTLERTSADWVNNIAYIGDELLKIGVRADTQIPLTGYVDEVGFWSKVLTQEEVTALWNSGSGLTHPFS